MSFLHHHCHYISKSLNPNASWSLAPGGAEKTQRKGWPFLDYAAVFIQASDLTRGHFGPCDDILALQSLLD